MNTTVEQRMLDTKFVSSLPTSRDAARRSGSKLYFTGVPCAYGHRVYRRTDNGGCAKCASLLSHKIQKALPKEVLKEYRRTAIFRWNASDRGKSAKQRWKARDPVWAWVVSAVGGARTRAKKRGLAFDLTNEFIYSIYTTHCPVLGVELVIGKKKAMPNSPTIDRLAPSRGYVKDNVAIISHRANAIKSDASFDELCKVVEWVHSVAA